MPQCRDGRLPPVLSQVHHVQAQPRANAEILRASIARPRAHSLHGLRSEAWALMWKADQEFRAANAEAPAACGVSWYAHAYM